MLSNKLYEQYNCRVVFATCVYFTMVLALKYDKLYGWKCVVNDAHPLSECGDAYGKP